MPAILDSAEARTEEHPSMAAFAMFFVSDGYPTTRTEAFQPPEKLCSSQREASYIYVRTSSQNDLEHEDPALTGRWAWSMLSEGARREHWASGVNFVLSGSQAGAGP